MIYTKMTVRAMQVAYEAHQGQYDKNGVPYIFHPYHVAEQMTDEVSVCAALLHDVVEDTEVSIEDLEQMFPKEVTEVLRLLTHDPKEDYEAYVRRAAAHPIARNVKLGDVLHNADQSRIVDPARIPPEKAAAWRIKYQHAREILEQNDAALKACASVPVPCI